MNKNKLIHEFLEVVSRGDVGPLICDHIAKSFPSLETLTFQHPKTGIHLSLLQQKKNLTEVISGVQGPLDGLLSEGFQE